MCFMKKPKAAKPPAPAPLPPEPSAEGIDIPEEVRRGKTKRSGRSSLRIPRTAASIGGTSGATGLNIPV